MENVKQKPLVNSQILYIFMPKLGSLDSIVYNIGFL